ncbi:uroporphyrinogen-III synthase [Vibrio sp. SS-MA-C1-2]|uniref:uroporphyrinogen-III synthase n=1 Tax=Vibrio sp. SS-MA-C1-2 TaxID=2908646 RepID=UPI001F29DC88|nr:uroporphyrinogen-III synthase [Vibrio sp. SS-MA-C1-2]UJF19405.1 uroporphyrinogen-III synthase [Vibrio sp. SS-MA-C1-2]
MSVLILRPKSEAKKLVAELQRENIPATYCSLFSIMPGKALNQLKSQLDTLRSKDFLIAVSVNAVKEADSWLKSQNSRWPTEVNYYAVGQKTAQALSQMTQCKVVAPQQQQTSEGLLEIAALKNTTTGKALILRGNGGRELIKTQLEEQGIDVQYCETYQRKWLERDFDQLAQHWQQSVKTVVVTSGEQLLFLNRNLSSALQQWLHGCRLYVPSERIKQQAKQLGFTSITSVGSAANSTLITVLRDDKQNGIIE